MNEILHLKPACEDSIIGFDASEGEWEDGKEYLKEHKRQLGCEYCNRECPIRVVLETPTYRQFRALIDAPALP